MKKLLLLINLSLMVVLSACASMSQQSTKASSDKPIYWIGLDGKFVRDSYGSCVRTIEWKQDLALAECEPGMAKKAKAIEPAPAATVSAPVAKSVPRPQATTEKVTLKAGAVFDVGKADLKPAGKSELDALVGKLKDSNTQIEQMSITGHTDSAGASEYNRQLSERRAEAVKAYLVSKGLNGDRIMTQGAGATQPVASNKTAMGRAQNRRVDIDIKAQRTTTPAN